MWYDLVSLTPSFTWNKVNALPVVGEKLEVIPSSFNITSFSGPSVIACVRHVGCPFAQREVMELAKLANENPSLTVFIVTMSEGEETKSWFSRIGGDEFKNPSQVHLVADISRETYGELGIGWITFRQLFGGDMWKALFKLKEEGIINTETGRGSNRYQNSGGIALDKDGIVRFVHLAVHAGDVVCYEDAVKSIM